MKIICAYSSLYFTCEHFPGTLDHRESAHPVFNLPQRKLLIYLSKWSAGELTPTDKYLLFLATLKSTELVDFRVPAIQTENTQQIISQLMEPLCKAVVRLASVNGAESIFPHYVITSETKTLENVEFWVQNWNEVFSDFKAGKLKGLEDRDSWQKLAGKERTLERLIRNPHRPVSSYSAQIAEWAAVAGKFPESVTVSRFSGLKCSISDYWKQIIHRCAHNDRLFSINRSDLEELLEHCETEIPIGTIYSNTLFKLLRYALDKQKSFLGLGDLDISGGTYKILSETDTVEAANFSAMIQAAPESEPRREQYPTSLAFMRAKMRWDLSKKYSKESNPSL